MEALNGMASIRSLVQRQGIGPYRWNRGIHLRDKELLQ